MWPRTHPRRRQRTTLPPIANILAEQLQLQQRFMQEAWYLCSQSNPSKLRWLADFHKAEQPNSMFNMYQIAQKTSVGGIQAYTPDTFCGVIRAPGDCEQFYECPNFSQGTVCSCFANCLNNDPTDSCLAACCSE